jgi:anti-sigma-K factor RskA
MVVSEHVTDLLPGYALGCLDKAEAEMVIAHLADCNTCRNELRSYQKVADALPLATALVEPPPGVKQRLMTSVQAPRQQPQSGLWQRFGQVFRRMSPAWGLVSLVLIVVLLASNLLLWRQVQTLSAAATPSTTMQIVALEHTTAAPDATGMLVISESGEYGTLTVDHLPPLGKNQQYQLWLIKDGNRTSGGVFSVNWDGYGSLAVSSPNPLDSYTAFGITVEPAGGSPSPTGSKVLGGNL